MAVAEQLGFKVRFGRGNFHGGDCVVKDEPIVILNRKHPPEIHIALLAGVLRELPTDTVFLKPAVRSALEEAWEDPVADSSGPGGRPVVIEGEADAAETAENG